MKKIIILLILCILVCAFISLHKSSPKNTLINLTKVNDIHLGRLKYRVYAFGVLPLAQAILENAKEDLYKGKKAYHLEAQAEILKLYEKLYKGAVQMTSYIDKETLLPLFFQQKVQRINRTDICNTVEYNQPKSILSLNGVECEVVPNLEDPISIFYNIINGKLIKNEDFNINLYTDKRVYTLEGKIKNESLIIKDKTYNLRVLDTNITKRGGKTYHNKISIKIYLIVNKEKENIPFLIDVFCRGILIKIKLVEIL